MKKILLGLGALGAVATPVIAVVACGNNAVDTKLGEKLTKDTLVSTLASKGYNLSDADATSLFNDFKLKDYSILKSFNGVGKSETHNSDDVVIVLAKNSKTNHKLLETDSGSSTVDKHYKMTDDAGDNFSNGIISYAEGATHKNSVTNWGQEFVDSLTQGKYGLQALYLQHNSTTNNSSIEVQTFFSGTIVDANGKITESKPDSWIFADNGENITSNFQRFDATYKKPVIK